MKAPQFWYPKNSNEEKRWLEILLLPLSFIYWCLYALRQTLSAPHKVSIPVICVGNAVAGGGGKTPAAIFLSKFIKSEGLFKNPVILSRGYGGRIKTPTLVNLESHTAKEVGDEPLLMARSQAVIIAKSKTKGSDYAVQAGYDCIIMDDGYQNPSLYKDINILLIDRRGFGNKKMIPAGPLRQPTKSALSKADMVFVRDNDFSEGNVPLIQTEYTVSNSTTKTKKVVGFAGTADPAHFKDTLAEKGYEIAAFHPFPDHHIYTKDELHQLNAEATAMNAQLVTTEKDYVRIPQDWQKQVASIGIELILKDHEAFKQSFKELIKARLS